MHRTAPIHALTSAVAMALVGGCGGSSPEAAEPVPEPVAVAPEATAGDDAAPQAGAAGTEAADGDATRAAADTPAPATPPDESQHRLSGARVQGQVRLDLFGGRLDASAGGDVGWWALVRAPDGTEQRFDLDRERFDTRVAGWQCRVGAVRASRSVQVSNGARTSRVREERELVCTNGRDRRTAVARCRVLDDSSSAAPSRAVQPAELDLGDPADPHEITLSCTIR